MVNWWEMPQLSVSEAKITLEWNHLSLWKNGMLHIATQRMSGEYLSLSFPSRLILFSSGLRLAISFFHEHSVRRLNHPTTNVLRTSQIGPAWIMAASNVYVCSISHLPIEFDYLRYIREHSRLCKSQFICLFSHFSNVRCSSRVLFQIMKNETTCTNSNCIPSTHVRYTNSFVFVWQINNT